MAIIDRPELKMRSPNTTPIRQNGMEAIIMRGCINRSNWMTITAYIRKILIRSIRLRLERDSPIRALVPAVRYLTDRGRFILSMAARIRRLTPDWSSVLR